MPGDREAEGAAARADEACEICGFAPRKVPHDCIEVNQARILASTAAAEAALQRAQKWVDGLHIKPEPGSSDQPRCPVLLLAKPALSPTVNGEGAAVQRIDGAMQRFAHGADRLCARAALDSTRGLTEPLVVNGTAQAAQNGPEMAEMAQGEVQGAAGGVAEGAAGAGTVQMAVSGAGMHGGVQNDDAEEEIAVGLTMAE